MRLFFRILFFFLLLFCFAGCNSSRTVFYEPLWRNNPRIQRFIGEFGSDDQLEKGNWSFSDSLGNVIERGEYCSGLRCGKWEHVVKGERIPKNWSTYQNGTLGFTLSIPDSFSTQLNQDGILIFDSRFNHEIFNVAILKRPKMEFSSLGDYKDFVLQDLKNQFHVKESSSLVFRSSEKKEFFYLSSIVQKDQQLYHFLSVFGFVNDGEILEIASSFAEADNELGMTYFSGILISIFVKGKRFIDPRVSVAEVSMNE